MKIITTVTIIDGEKRHPPGSKLEVDDVQGEYLIKARHAVEDSSPAEPAGEKKAGKAADKAA